MCVRPSPVHYFCFVKSSPKVFYLFCKRFPKGELGLRALKIFYIMFGVFDDQNWPCVARTWFWWRVARVAADVVSSLWNKRNSPVLLQNLVLLEPTILVPHPDHDDGDDDQEEGEDDEADESDNGDSSHVKTVTVWIINIVLLQLIRCCWCCCWKFNWKTTWNSIYHYHFLDHLPINILSRKPTLFSTWNQIVTFSVRLNSFTWDSHSHSLLLLTMCLSSEMTTRSTRPASLASSGWRVVEFSVSRYHFTWEKIKFLKIAQNGPKPLLKQCFLG